MCSDCLVSCGNGAFDYSTGVHKATGGATPGASRESEKMKITVVTATYNRRNLLRQVFDSLKAQNYQAIEWIVVDDGGSDNTEEAVAAFQPEASFVIRYVRQENSGKPRAVNHGLELATGDLVCVVDDDDYFLPDVFQRVVQDYSQIANREDVGGLSYLALDPAGKLWGQKFPADYLISDHYECRLNRRITGDKCEFYKGVVFREHGIRFPESKSRGGIGGDTIFHLAIADKFQTCYINTPVLVKNYLGDGITVNWRKKALQNPERAALYYSRHLNPRLRLGIRWRYMVAYVAITLYAQQSIRFSSFRPFSNRLLSVAAFVPGMILARRWRAH